MNSLTNIGCMVSLPGRRLRPSSLGRCC
jgi:hypothetical protein